jgi:protein SCO1/2
MKSIIVGNLLIPLAAMVLLLPLAEAQIIQPGPPSELKAVDVTEELGAQIPLDLTFTNDAGEKVQLSQYFNQGKPVILILAYYHCPMLCTLVLDGMAKGLNQLDWNPGEKYQVLTVSIDSTETVESAGAKREQILKILDKPGGDFGWRFFVGDVDQIKALAHAVGFQYYFDKKLKQYAHPAVAMVLTPDGHISRYLYGVEFKKNDLRLSLLEASNGKIGTTIDRVILFCYHYNPDAKGYVLFASNLMKLGGILTVFGIGFFLMILWKRDFRSKTDNKPPGNRTGGR